MRRGTLLAIVALLVLIGAAAVYQLLLASRNQAPYPGPRSGTPFPTNAVTP